MEYNLEEILEIFNKEETITSTAKAYCEKHGYPYNDSVRKRFSRIINRSEVINDTTTESNDYPEISSSKGPLLNAFKDDKTLMNIDEYCEAYNLDRSMIRSFKLITHTGIPYYNIVFYEDASVIQDIDVEFISEVVQKYIKPLSWGGGHEIEPTYVDRLVLTDVHINMNNHGSPNKLPIYEDALYDEDEIFRRLNIVVEHVEKFSKSNQLIIDNLGDFMDGEKGQTTRGGHALPQLYSDKKAFEIGVQFQVELVEKLLRTYSTITLNNITDDNHSFLLGYYVHSAAKRILEAKYPERVTYNIVESFVTHYEVGKHLIVLSHGKDSSEMKFGWKPRLDDKLVKSIDCYLKHHGLYNGNSIEISKGDSHQYISDYTTSLDFEYHTYPSFSPPSSWVQHNFQNSRSGIVFQNISTLDSIKTVTPKFF